MPEDTKYRYKEQFMTEEEIGEINNIIAVLNANKGTMAELYAEWADIEEYYQNEQDEVDKMPNSRVNIINCNIEGQASMVVEQDIAITTRGESAGDEDYAEDARVGLEWTLRKNYIKNVTRMNIRRLLKYGAEIYTVLFDPDALNEFGLVKIFPVPLNRIFIDGKIKDFLRLQEAEYIAEVITLSKGQFEDIYSEEKTSAVMFGNIDEINDPVFEVTDSDDDQDAASLVRYWSRKKGKLRLREFSGCGLLMYDSHKSGDRDENQKSNKSSINSYYKYVDNKYPYFMTVLYPREGNLFGFGDGKLLLPLQKLLNELYDKIRICARPNLIVVDVDSELDVDDFDENCLEPRPYVNNGNANPIHAVPWGVINEAWWRLLANVHEEIQKVTRFSGLMMGQQKSSDTATEAAIQQQQGNMATDDKKGMVATTLQQVCEYTLALMMEFYTEGKTFRTKADENEYKYIDFRQMTKVPVKIPATNDMINSYYESNPEQQIPKWELLTDSKGSPVTKNVDLDIEVNIGAGLPKNKAFMTKFIQDLAQIQLVDDQGMPRPAVYWKEFRDFMQKYIGLPLKDADEIIAQAQQQMMQQQQMAPPPEVMGTQGQPNMNADTQGLGANGGVQQSPVAMGNSQIGGMVGG